MEKVLTVAEFLRKISGTHPNTKIILQTKDKNLSTVGVSLNYIQSEDTVQKIIVITERRKIKRKKKTQ